MREVENFINAKQIENAVLYVGENFQSWRLREIIDRTLLKNVIITGKLTNKHIESLLEDIDDLVKTDNVKKEIHLCYMPIEKCFDKKKTYDLVFFESVDDVSNLFFLQDARIKYLVGNMNEQNLSSFALWEKFKKTCESILIVTNRVGLQPQVLDWNKNKNNNIEISVIFPVYNVSKYLKQCIESVTKWKSDYIEFLFVNDGSPDDSREIILEAAKKDKRIKLLDKENGGCASARQYGLEQAKGRYIGFIDPDDFIDESMYRKLFRAAMIGSYEISYCGYNNYYETTEKSEQILDCLGWPYCNGVTNQKEIIPLIAFCRVAIWRGIYKKEMLDRDEIHFYTDLRRFDDLPFKVETFARAKSVIAVGEYLYNYRLERPGQDVSANDDRLYVHFPIFSYLNSSVASTKNQRIIDYLQMCKVQTHRYAISKIKEEYLSEYVKKAKADLKTTGSFYRTERLIKKELGKRAQLYYKAIMTNNIFMLKILNSKGQM